MADDTDDGIPGREETAPGEHRPASPGEEPPATAADDPGAPEAAADGGFNAGLYVKDLAVSVGAVLVIGGLLVAVSGVWPPMVAVESGSMEPNMQVGDLVFVVDNDRFVPDRAQEHDGVTTGVVPADRADETGRTTFGGPGDVIVFRPDGNGHRTPIIHRAMLWVEEGEDWYDRADPAALGGAGDCAELQHCPAPHAGFVTKGDANEIYDQQTPRTAPVRPEWIVGTAAVRVPYLGYFRLYFSGQVAAPLAGGWTPPGPGHAGPGSGVGSPAAA